MTRSKGGQFTGKADALKEYQRLKLSQHEKHARFHSTEHIIELEGLSDSPEVYHRIEDWRTYVYKASPKKPNVPTLNEYRDWDLEKRRAYDESRLDYHAKCGPIITETMISIHRSLLAQIDLNIRGGSGARQGGVIDGLPTLGKTTILIELGKRFEKDFRRRYPLKNLDQADLLIPVVYITLKKKTTPKTLDEAIANFYGIPLPRNLSNITHNELTNAIEKFARIHRTYLFLIDDIHMLGKKGRDADVNDHLKSLMSLIPATFVFAGIDCKKSALFSDEINNRKKSQMGGRLVTHSVEPLLATDVNWLKLIKTFEDHFVLFHHVSGSLIIPEVSKYLHQRTGGAIGPLSQLLRAAANEAIRNRYELIDISLLDKIKSSHNSSSFIDMEDES